MPSPSHMVRAAARPVASAGTSNLLAGVLQAPDTFLDCTSVTTSGSTVTAFVDRNNAARTFTSGATAPALPATDAALNSQLSVTLASSRFTSNQAASFWANFHNGTGMEWYFVFVPTTNFTGEKYLINTEGSGNQVIIKTNGTDGHYEHYDATAGGANVYMVAAHGMSLNTGYCLNGYNSNATAVFNRNNTSIASQTPFANHGAAANAQTLRLFDDGFGSYFTGRFAMLLAFNRVLSTGDRTTVRSYITSTYGISFS